MYTEIHTEYDVLRERFIYGCELTSLGYPKLPKVNADEIEVLKSVSFNLASKEKNPRKCICHFYIDDQKFMQFWRYPEKYIPILKNFKYVISPDFSAFDTMPKPLQYYQYYRDRATAFMMMVEGINVIPNCGWGGEESWGFCFEGLPTESTLAITTNGRDKDGEREYFLAGYEEMMKRLNPSKIVCVGKLIEGMEREGLKIIALDSFSQQWSKRTGSKVESGDANGQREKE